MLQVKCYDDKNLPEGACVVEGNEYEVVEEFINFYDQKTYILKGVLNEGVTKMGMKWKGYRAVRFQVLEPLLEVEEVNYESSNLTLSHSSL